jgi:hypothetical protein
MKPNTSSERLWRTIRALRKFTIDELMSIAQVGEVKVRSYLSLLHTGGYLKTVTSRIDGRRRVYKLIKDTGAKHPRERVCLYDPNTGEYIHPKGKF